MAKKDAMGQQVDSLYLSLGLNVADLEMGFQTAGQTVRQAMSRLNSEANQIRLKADIDVTRLEAAGKSVDALKVREKALNDELAVQQKKLELLNRAYEANAKTYGPDHSLTRGVDTKRLYQTRDIEQLKAQIAQLNAELGKTETKATTAFGKLKAEAAKANGSVKGMVSSIDAVNAKIAAVSGAIAGGAGLFSLTDDAMKKGNDLYLLSTRLHTTAAEAGKLQKMFAIAGVDVNAGISALVRLDKQALSAGDSENTLTKAMQEFGFTLMDSQGNLLPYSQQLEQVNKGYRKAAADGKEAEFMAATFGAKGAGLAPLLQDFEMLREVINGIQSTGLLDPQASRELFIEWSKMKYQMGQMTGAVGQAMLPIAKELMPEITETFKEFTLLIKDNTADIKEFGSAAGTAIGGLSSAIVSLISVMGDLKKELSDISGTAKDIELLKANGMEGYLSKGKTAGAIIGGMVGGSAFGPAGAVGGAALGANVGESIYGKVGALLTPEKELAAAKQRIALKEQEKKAFEEFNKQITESQKNAYSSGIQQEKDLAKEMKDVAKEAKAANKELEKSIYSLTHSDLQNSLHGVDMAAKAFLEKGADPDKVALEAQLKKGKILEAQEKEVAQYLDSVYADSLTQRLNQIEREKKAWIQKGLDEVRATQAAEQQKRNAVNDSVKSMFTSQKKYLEIYRDAMAGRVGGKGVYMYDYKLSQEERQRNAAKAIQAEMMKEAGVKPWERTSVSEVLGFQRVMKDAGNWGLSLLKDRASGGTSDMGEISRTLTESNAQISSLLGQISGNGIASVNANLEHILDAIGKQSQSPQVNVCPSINVDLGGAYVFDNRMKQELVDDITTNVANGVSQAAKNALNSINYGYGG